MLSYTVPETHEKPVNHGLFLFLAVPCCPTLSLLSLYAMVYAGHISITCGHTRMKRTDIKRRPLSDTVLSKLEPELKTYRELDGNGL